MTDPGLGFRWSHKLTRPATVPAPRWRDDLPPGVLGYLVAKVESGRAAGVSHTTLMPLEEAQREALKLIRGQNTWWVPVEIREVPRDR